MNIFEQLLMAIRRLLGGIKQVEQQQSTGTLPPLTLTLTAPSLVDAPGALSLEALVGNAQGAPTVQFFRGDALLSTQTAPPYTLPIGLGTGDNGSVLLRAEATDRTNRRAQASMTVSVNIPVVVLPDTSAPTLALTTSSSNLTAPGLLTLTADVADDQGVQSVAFYRDGTLLATQITPPFTVSENVSRAENGSYGYRAVATDTAGNVAEQSLNVVVAIPDTTGPSLALSASSESVTAAGVLTVTAASSDESGIDTVLFYRGQTLIQTERVVPYRTSLTLTRADNGTLNIRAVASDRAGNTTERSLSITVNIPPAPSATLSNDGHSFHLSWPRVENASEYVVERSYGETGRQFVPLNTETLIGTTYSDCTVYDGVHVWYRVHAIVAGQQRQIAALDGVHPGRSGWIDGPYTISQGGTYTGLRIRLPDWVSGNSGAINITTTDPVTLIDCCIASTKHAIHGNSMRLTVRNTCMWALNPGGVNRTHGKSINNEYARHCDVQSSHMEGFIALEFKNYGGNRAGETLIVKKNTFVNVAGMRTDGNGGYQDYTAPDGHDNTFTRAQAVLFNTTTNIPGVEIAFNRIVNEAYFSRVEDNINTFGSSGTAASPIWIHDNAIWGAYPYKPADPRSTYFTGGGIMVGDVGSGYVLVERNFIIGTQNYGISLLGGNNSIERDNKIIKCPYLWDGRRITQSYGWALAYWNYNKADNTVFRDNLMTNNTYGYQGQKADGTLTTNLLNVSGKDLAGANNQYGPQTALAGPFTFADEYAAIQEYRGVVTAAGLVIGPQAA